MTTERVIRPDIAHIPVPERMLSLPLDERGYPVPWFVSWVDGKPEFRALERYKLVLAVREKRCWLCGEKMGRFLAFVIGPMCAINRISSEPPSHRECAEYAVRACPFLARPHMRRRENDLPEDFKQAAGFGVKRNPGVSLIWVTESYRVEKAHAGNEGYLFHVGDPYQLAWYAEGREATRAEIMESIDSGYPLLVELACQQGPEAERELVEARERAMELVPEV